MVDTHCHLNFKAFDGQVEEVIRRAKTAGVDRFIVPGTDIETSKKAVELAEKYKEVYAAVGIHPHHIYQYQKKNKSSATQFFSHESLTPRQARGPLESEKIAFASDIKIIEKLLNQPKVVAVGEVGIDRYYYRDTKYSKYVINPEFIELQKTAFLEQIKLAVKYKKSLIIHNREAVGETLEIIGDSSILNSLAGHIVFHCCEANDQLLEFALAHHIYIGVDGDVTYDKPFGKAQGKKEFVKKIPLELLVLETDAPFLLPRLHQDFGGQAEPLKKPNEPKNLQYIAEKISQIKDVSINQLIDTTTKNSKNLFNL